MCKLCGQTFAQNGSFRMHERRHMMEMLHKCPICPVKFSQWEDAKAHLATHPEISGVADFMKHLPTVTSAGETDDENMPPIDSFAPHVEQLHMDQFPPPGFPFPSQLSPFLNLSSLHFGAALGEIATPVGLFATQGQVSRKSRQRSCYREQLHCLYPHKQTVCLSVCRYFMSGDFGGGKCCTLINLCTYHFQVVLNCLILDGYGYDEMDFSIYTIFSPLFFCVCNLKSIYKHPYVKYRIDFHHITSPGPVWDCDWDFNVVHWIIILLR